MRNFYELLGLARQTPSSTVKQTLNELSAEQLADEADLLSVMENNLSRTHYRRVHLQYDAIAAALSNPALQSSGGAFSDTHQWEKRAVEFEPNQDTIELSS